MKNIFLTVLLCLLFIPSVNAEQSKVVFTDGSSIFAEVISMQDGVYTLRSASLGEITVPAEQISNISAMGANKAQIQMGNSLPQGNEMSAQINALSGKIMNDPKLMQSMTELMNDPQVMQLLSDPAIMEAVNSGNIQALMNNPKLMQLINNPNVNSMINQMKGQ